MACENQRNEPLRCWRSSKIDHLCALKIDQGWMPGKSLPESSVVAGTGSERFVGGANRNGWSTRPDFAPTKARHVRQPPAQVQTKLSAFWGAGRLGIVIKGREGRLPTHKSHSKKSPKRDIGHSQVKPLEAADGLPSMQPRLTSRRATTARASRH